MNLELEEYVGELRELREFKKENSPVDYPPDHQPMDIFGDCRCLVCAPPPAPVQLEFDFESSDRKESA